jgi:hypothetical protein
MQDALYLNSLFGEILKMFEDQEKKINVSIEREETKPKDWVKETGLRIKKQRKGGTGIVITISDDPYPIVTHIQALTREELPLEYLVSDLPKVWMYKDKLFSEVGHILLEKNKKKPYSRQEIADALLHIRLAGEHLAAVNKPKARYLRYRHAATFKDGRFT